MLPNFVILNHVHTRLLGPKNYAEWRSSWHHDGNSHQSENVGNPEGGGNFHENDIYTQVNNYFDDLKIIHLNKS